MTVQPPSLPGGNPALGLAWTIPVLLLVYMGLGFWLGGLFGSRMVGVLIGWLAGMGGVFYEIRRVLRSGTGTRPPPPAAPRGDAT
jgi:hypothetical protein